MGREEEGRGSRETVKREDSMRKREEELRGLEERSLKRASPHFFRLVEVRKGRGGRGEGREGEERESCWI